MTLQEAFDLVDSAIDQIKITGEIPEEVLEDLKETQYRIRVDIPELVPDPNVKSAMRRKQEAWDEMWKEINEEHKKMVGD